MNFLKLPKELFFDDKYKDLSISAKVLYAFLLDRYSLSQVNNWLDKDGRVYVIFTREEAAQKLGCKQRIIGKYYNELEQVGLIYQKGNGIGKAKNLYVNEIGDSHRQKSAMPQAKNGNEHRQKLPSNNTDINNTDISQSETDELLFKILQNCELEIWSDGTGEMLRSIITELYYLPFVYVHGVRFDTAYIRSKLVGLSADALIRVVDTLKGKDVKNVHAYMQHAVLNAVDDYAADLIINS